MKSGYARVQVFKNGWYDQAKQITGSSIEEILRLASEAHALHMPGKLLFTREGRRIREFADLELGMEVVVTTGDPFKP